jgi:voltage-gated potassium channel
MIKNRLYPVFLSISIVIMVGSIGYFIIFGNEASFLDCMYMTVISLTTVGYGEVIDVSSSTPAKIFTMILITFGMGIILYGISTVTAIIVEGELSGLLRKKKMTKKIEDLTDHYIVCGGGETGRPVLFEFDTNNEPMVLIESSHETIKKCQASIENLLFIQGDATEDENLVKAGINVAAGIIISLPSDKDNLYITMAARMLNPDIRIISRMTSQKLRPKLYKGGANGVVSPNTIGALRLASEMLRPTAVDFLDTMLRSKQGNIRINQITVPDNSKFIGKTIQETKLRDKFNLLILGIKEKHQELEFDPDPSKVLSPGATFIIMGDINHYIDARNRISQTI